MAARLRVGVLFGGRSGEHQVSVVSAASVKSIVYRDTADKALNWMFPAPPLQVSNGPDQFIHVI